LALPMSGPQLLLGLSEPPAPSLDNFVVGRNAPVLAALRALGGETAPGVAAEPCLYLFGAPGSGRSHLLKAWTALHGGTYFDAALSHTDAPKHPLEGHFEGTALAVDNCQLLDEASQIALFNTYNRARLGQARLLVAGHAPPMQLALREDVKSRLAWGVALEVFALDDDERMAALLQHATARGMRLGSGVIEYVSTHGRRDMPSLMALLDALDVASLQSKRPITLPFVREQLQGALQL
jgi:DnaA-homolog protein